jgi:hypothetical protein
MTPGAAFHLPGVSDIWLLVIAFVAMVIFNEGLVLIFGFRMPFWNKATKLALLVLVACTALREDLGDVLKFVSALWLWLGPKVPWDGMKKKLASTISSLTEVARASIQRQQAEAFS